MTNEKKQTLGTLVTLLLIFIFLFCVPFEEINWVSSYYLRRTYWEVSTFVGFFVWWFYTEHIYFFHAGDLNTLGKAVQHTHTILALAYLYYSWQWRRDIVPVIRQVVKFFLAKL